jgi:predicted small lipoprotein YifL
VNARILLGLALAGLAASGCGLKGPLYLPEKSDVTIRPAPAATPSATPAEAAAPEKGQPAPEQPAKPEQAPQDPKTGPDRG